MRTIVRHQLGSLAATITDFSVMMFIVSVLGFGPTVGTAIGATCGGIFNFILGRRWIFRATQGRTHHQAFRYALISASSLLLNTGGEYVLATRLHFPYVAARVAVSIFVGLAWNYPMQKFFVFRIPRASEAR